MGTDIVIIGAGPAGLSFARALNGSGLAITLIDRQDEAALADPPYDGREIALTHHSRRLMVRHGLWQHVPEEHISLIRHARVLNGKSGYSLHFDHREAGRETLGFMISNHRIRKAAYDAVKEMEGVTLLTGASVVDVRTDSAEGMVTLGDGTTLTAPLVVAADSRFSASRRMMGIPASMLDFGRTCIVCRMTAEKPHGDTALECFHYGRTLAILPLPDNEVSIVITVGSDQDKTVLDQPEAEFNADIMRRTGHRFGEMRLVSERFAYPLVAVHANRFHTRRYALVGDAAVGMHPVTAHGFNLGLRGADILAEELLAARRTGGDIGAAGPLARYSSRHSQRTLPLYHGTNAIVRLYTQETLPAKLARAVLLRLGSRVKPAKRLIMDQLTEISPA
ncbi:MAG: 5-demethoxyubiquinol-8 5-hydroxylase UbiM [Rhodospirillaceae bacterium]|nr:5-demethoxyubiquinol-8 5-hydroxylase UbiM [Rhodospirillaceae bacterium]